MYNLDRYQTDQKLMCNTQQPFQSWHKIAKLKRYHKEHQAQLRSLVNKLDWSPEVVRLWL